MDSLMDSLDSQMNSQHSQMNSQHSFPVATTTPPPSSLASARQSAPARSTLRVTLPKRTNGHPHESPRAPAPPSFRTLRARRQKRDAREAPAGGDTSRRDFAASRRDLARSLLVKETPQSHIAHSPWTQRDAAAATEPKRLADLHNSSLQRLLRHSSHVSSRHATSSTFCGSSAVSASQDALLQRTAQESLIRWRHSVPQRQAAQGPSGSGRARAKGQLAWQRKQGSWPPGRSDSMSGRLAEDGCE